MRAIVFSLASLLVTEAHAQIARPSVAQTDITAPASSSLSFTEALRRAIEANSSIQRARADVAVAEAQKDIIFSSVLPRVAISGSGIRNTENVQFGEGDQSRTILPENDWNARLTLSQPIYAGNRERRAYEQSKLAVLSAGETVRSTEDQVLLVTAADYLGVVQGQGLVAAERLNVELSERRLKQARDFFEAGEVTRVEVLRGEASVKGAQRRLAGAIQQRDTAGSRLRINLNVTTPVTVTKPTFDLGTLDKEAQLVERALSRRPAVRQAENNLAVAKLEVRKQRGAYMPVVSADAAYVQQKSTFPSDSYGQAALRVTIPIYQGGEIGARVALARERERQAELALAELKQAITEDVRRGLLDLTAAETSLALAREQLEAAQAEYEQTFELYQAQEATSLDVQSAETSLADARRAVVTSELDRDLARFRVLSASGSFREAVLKEGEQQ
ncbi:MAG TPA: TolC family protein [Thermoanaerobaculia bacterium]|nr:TolC family protein [Thermoanaerobaculia bacterium]